MSVTYWRDMQAEVSRHFARKHNEEISEELKPNCAYSSYTPLMQMIAYAVLVGVLVGVLISVLRYHIGIDYDSELSSVFIGLVIMAMIIFMQRNEYVYFDNDKIVCSRSGWCRFAMRRSEIPFDRVTEVRQRINKYTFTLDDGRRKHIRIESNEKSRTTHPQCLEARQRLLTLLESRGVPFSKDKLFGM